MQRHQTSVYNWVDVLILNRRNLCLVRLRLPREWRILSHRYGDPSIRAFENHISKSVSVKSRFEMTWWGSHLAVIACTCLEWPNLDVALVDLVSQGWKIKSDGYTLVSNLILLVTYTHIFTHFRILG